MPLELQLLGVPRVAVDGLTTAVAWPRRSLSVLTYLTVARGRVTRDAVAFALWPDDDEEDARGNLRRNLNLLRATLPPAVARWILVDGGSIGFDHAAAATDVAAFDSFATNPATYLDAVRTYTGDFAAPLYDSWALTERERLRARFHAILGELCGQSFSARRFDEALAFARRIKADEPFREDIVRRILAIRYAMGDRPGALSEFERFRRELERELAVAPMPETRALHDVILRGDPLPFALDVGIHDVPSGIPSATALLPFGGRATSLDRLRSAWQTAATSGGALMFVGGEAGIGKTRIVSEFLEQDVGTSARLLRGTTGSPETRPFEAILAALAQTAPFLSTIEIEPIWPSILAPLVPQIAARAAEIAVPALPPERETLRLFEAVAKVLAAVARVRPVVVVLEDLHWAGPATLAAIRHLATRIRGHRIFLIVTYRAGESPPLEGLRRELRASGHADGIRLAPLSDTEALAVLARLSTAPPAADARLLVARSEGNPLFLTELLREYPRSLTAVADGIADIVTSRLERSSTGAQTLARTAAICGSTFDLDMLHAVLGWGDETLIDGLAELLDRQFIRATATHERGSYAFSHALIRDSVAAGTSARDQQRIHHIVARALEARLPNASYAVEIALHWQGANEPERAASAYAHAARASLRTQARDEAALLATTGERLTRDPRRLFELVRLRLEANVNRIEAPALRADVERLASIAASLDEEARYAAALLACRIEETQGDPAVLRDRTTALHAYHRADDPRRAAEIAEIDAANALRAGNTAAAIAATESARERYEAVGALSDELRAAIRIARMDGRIGNSEAAFARLAMLEARVNAAADPQVTIDYWFARTTEAHARYDAPGMLYATGRLDRAARAAGDRLMEGHVAYIASSAHGLADRLTHAFRETDRAIEIYRAIGATAYIRSIEINRAAYLIQAGRAVEAIAVIEAELAHARANGLRESEYFLVSNLGVAQLVTGAAAAAVVTQHEALRLAREIGSDAFEALVLGDLGAAQATTGAIAEGVANLRTAAAMNRRLKREATRAHDLARAARWEPEPSVAAAYAREALAIVETDDGIKHASEILWCCALAFERAAEPGAAAYARRTGRATLERRAAAIEDEHDRRCYRRLPHNADLLAADAVVK